MKRYKFNNLKDFTTNTQAACYLSSLNLPYKTLIALLKSDDFYLKHFALININSIDTTGMDILIFNLTGQDSKIRECASLKIKHFVEKTPSLISLYEKRIDTICQSLNDVNPQVCRNIIDTFEFIENKDIFIEKILYTINSILEELDIKNIVKNHKFNKKIFNLYWNLYALENLIYPEIKNTEIMYKIIENLILANNYTIRERTAKIILKLENYKFDIKKFKNILEKDENFYVRTAITSSHSRE